MEPSSPPSLEGPGDGGAGPGAVATPTKSGWYPDPYGRFARRWWDGKAWSAYAGDTDVQWDPAPVEAVEIDETGTPSVGFAIGVGGFVLGAALTIALQQVVDFSEQSLAVEILVPSIPLWVTMLAACVLAHRRYGTASFAQAFRLRVRWIDLAFGLSGSIAGRMMVIAASPPVPVPTRRLRDAEELSEHIQGSATWIALFLALCVGAPIFEELLFRGLLQPVLVKRLGLVGGLALCSALFGAAHLLGWDGPLTLASVWAITFGGLALGVIRHYSGRLTPAILAHALFNGQVYLLIALTN